MRHVLRSWVAEEKVGQLARILPGMSYVDTSSGFADPRPTIALVLHPMQGTNADGRRVYGYGLA